MLSNLCFCVGLPFNLPNWGTVFVNSLQFLLVSSHKYKSHFYILVLYVTPWPLWQIKLSLILSSLILFQGGTFYFFEHTKSKLVTFLRLRQCFCCIMWYFLFGRCRLLRDNSQHIEQAGFSTYSYEKLNHSSFFTVQSPTIFGVATK